MSQSKGSILVVEDEDNLRDALKLNLELEGYSVTCAENGAIALKRVEEEYFDLVILDVMLPEVDGFDVCQGIRLKNIESPILMLSARSGSDDRVTGLKRGADDYLTKPFNLEELLLRIEKLIDKNRKINEQHSVGESFSFGGNTIDFKAQNATNHKGELISLSKKEIMLLKLMIEYRNEVVSREKILQAVWGYQVFPTTRTIDNFILSFRKYFETDPREPRHFHSVRGVGYKFSDE
ncbi:MAG: response regulator transcription factor [Bacteroidetes bacterium]|nr:response regulator transcription factor [Bacteroidota bacterium]